MKKLFLSVFPIFIVITFFSCRENNQVAPKQFAQQKEVKKEAVQTSPGNTQKTPATAPLQAVSNSKIIAQKIKSDKTDKDDLSKETPEKMVETEEHDMYDGAKARDEFEYNQIKDPVTGIVPNEKLLIAKQKAEESKNIFRTSTTSTVALTWSERGPVFDSVGPSNGNGRGGVGGTTFPNTYTSGRIRAVLVDASDATGNTVFVGGVDGGLWKCTNFITGAIPNWVVVNDFFSNLAICNIVQDPITPDIMYFSTGEPTANADAVLGNGVWKSTNHGVTWSLLASTSTYTRTFRIIVDNSHNIYLALRGGGLKRSTDGGTSFTDITPTGISSTTSCTDIELSTNGKFYASFGYNTSLNIGTFFRFTSTPSTIGNAGWSSATTGMPDTLGFNRLELTSRGDTIYAAPTNNANNVISTYKSTDGGVTWSRNNTIDYTSGVSNSQGWYNITLELSPVSTGTFLVGGLDEYLSSDSGKTVSVITNWVSTPPYVHADHHFTKWVFTGGESRIMVACDGGIFLSRNNGLTFIDRNQNLGIKQFYSVAVHPTTTNYFLAGAQDNGVHQLTKPGLASSVEVTGGDGAFTAIDQDEPQYQFGSYVYNQYRKSTNGGTSWSSFNPCSSCGFFINPFDYDNNNNKIYAAYNAGTYLRWDNPQTGTSTTSVSLSGMNSNYASAIKVSPYTGNLIYIGTNNQNATTTALKVANANTSTPTVTNIYNSGLPSGNISCINTGTDDQNLILCYSNYNITHVWVTTNGGTSWTNVDGNLPNMPVRWAMFYPGNNTKAVIATETGVWETTSLSGAATVWAADPTFPNVRTDMLQFRPSDGTIAAATHGRGLWTAVFPITTTTWTGNVSSSWTTAGNWDNGVPDAGTNAIIPNVSPKPFPVMSTNQGVFNLTVNSSASITVTSPGNLQIGALFVNNGTISGTGTTTLMNGGAGAVTGTGTISNWTLTGGANIASGSSQSITGVLSVAGTLFTNGGLTLKSSAAGTASIAPITNGSISGNVTVERYFSNRRSWRLLGIPFASSSQTIKAAWQEGATTSAQNLNPNFGTHITTFTGDPNASNFDAEKPSSSIRLYAGDAFTSDASHTPNTTINVAANQAYFLFVRGDRSSDLPVRVTTSSTATLRITGAVATGSVSRGVTGTSFSLIPNPYPSTLNFDSLKAVTANSGITTFYVWDATLAPFGQYRTISITGSAPAYTYTATPGGADNTWRFIESGTAFMIPGSSAVSFTENCKSSSTPPSSMLRTATTTSTETEMVVNLYSVNSDNTTSLSDGIREVFGNTYAATIDRNDAKKIEGFNTNLGIASNNDVLAIEKRPLPGANEIIQLKLWNTTPGNYEFEVVPSNFSTAAQFVYLRDNYLNTFTPVNASANTIVNFSITSDAASAGENRFSILFTNSAIAPGKPLIVVYPNPVTNGIVQLQLNNMPKGLYNARLINSVGQIISSRQINHADGTSVETIPVNRVKGTYLLEVTMPDKTKEIHKVIIN